MKLYIYTFEDGTNMKIVNCPLTIEELYALERLHGECISSTIEIKAESMDNSYTKCKCIRKGI